MATVLQNAAEAMPLSCTQFTLTGRAGRVYQAVLSSGHAHYWYIDLSVHGCTRVLSRLRAKTKSLPRNGSGSLVYYNIRCIRLNRWCVADAWIQLHCVSLFPIHRHGSPRRWCDQEASRNATLSGRMFKRDPCSFGFVRVLFLLLHGIQCNPDQKTSDVEFNLWSWRTSFEVNPPTS